MHAYDADKGAVQSVGANALGGRDRRTHHANARDERPRQMKSWCLALGGLAAALVGAAACNAETPQGPTSEASLISSAPPPLFLDVPGWTDPAILALFRESVHEIHRPMAISFDGSTIALPVPGAPVNELTLLDWRKNSISGIRYPERVMKLGDPAFSPNGEYIAFIVTPPSYFGISELWVTDLLGRLTVRLRADRQVYTYPVFLDDERRIAYFRSVNPPIDDSAEIRVQPEFRQLSPKTIFVFDMDVGEETRVTDSVWSSGSSISYSTDDDRIIARVGSLMAPSVIDGVEHWIHSDTAWNSSSGRQQSFQFQLSRRHANPPDTNTFYQTVRRIDDQDYRITRETPNGVMLLDRLDRRDGEYLHSLHISIGQALDQIVPPQVLGQQTSVISGNGCVVAYRLLWREPGTTRVDPRSGFRIVAVDRCSQTRAEFGWEDLVGTQRVLMLDDRFGAND